MSIQRLGSVFLPVRSLENSIAFYTELLGLVCRGIEDWEEGRRGATIFCNPHPEQGALLTLVETKDPIPALRTPVINFACSDAASLHAVLSGKGCQITALETWDSPWNHHELFDVTDPDGHLIGLIMMVPLTKPQTVSQIGD